MKTSKDPLLFLPIADGVTSYDIPEFKPSKPVPVFYNL
jgi:hypothetical protein